MYVKDLNYIQFNITNDPIKSCYLIVDYGLSYQTFYGIIDINIFW